MMYNTFFQERMVFCQRREFAEDPGSLPHDQSNEAQRQTEVEQVQRYFIRRGCAEDHLVKIQPVTEYQKYGHKSYRAIVTFRTPFHQDEQRAYEVDDQV